jgi:hypothetical protein
MMQRLLVSVDFNFLWGEILRLVRDPYSNIAAALLLLALVVTVLVVASIVIAIAMGWASQPRRSDELEELQHLLSVLEAEEGEGDPGAAKASETPHPTRRTLRERLRGYPWLAALGIAAATIAVIGIAVGVTTSSSSVCGACHISTSHTDGARAGTPDPHATTSCVRCHESSGLLGSATIEVPQRLAHFLHGVTKTPGPDQYGFVASSACDGCHASVGVVTTVDEARGIRMAHKHPLRAGAQCLDCHSAGTGVVSTFTVGMVPCLRCHDGKQQPAKCTLCHMKDVTYATRSHSDPAELTGRKLIEIPDCGLCHNMKQECDPCHGGVRMPHTQLFKAYGHAREGAIDIWFNNGTACKTCHTAFRLPCTRCHAFFPGHPVNAWPKMHGVKTNSASCGGCHNKLAFVPERDFCMLCHQKPYVMQ